MRLAAKDLHDGKKVPMGGGGIEFERTISAGAFDEVLRPLIRFGQPSSCLLRLPQAVVSQCEQAGTKTSPRVFRDPGYDFLKLTSAILCERQVLMPPFCLGLDRQGFLGQLHKQR